MKDAPPATNAPPSRDQSGPRGATTLPTGVTPELLAKLSGLELRARTIVEGLISGKHRSPHHGISVEFAEHRQYVPGDDLRYVDWKLYGKSDRYFLKQFEEETNFHCQLLLDVSESMRYRSADAALSKLEYAAALTAALASLVLRQQDAVGLMTFEHRLDQVLRPSGAPSQLDPILKILEQTEPSRVATVDGPSPTGPADVEPSSEMPALSLEPALHAAASRLKSRSIVVVLSDLFADEAGFERGLKLLRHGRHDVIIGQVIDPAEQDFPFEESTRFVGLEGTGERRVDPRALRRAYREEFSRFLHSTERITRDLGMDYRLIRTDRPLDAMLSSLLRRGRSRN